MENKIKSLIELNKKHSDYFCSQRLERELYLAKHPTKIVVFKCMDGRVHMPSITRTPLGIMRPYRNLGGKFNLGWPLLSESFDRTVMRSVAKGNRLLALVTYHYSNGDKHRGCAGFGYNCEEAKKFTENFRKQILRVYGENNSVVFPVLVGIETDQDALVIHGEKGELVDVSDLGEKSSTDILELIRKIFPSMPEVIAADFLPLIEGNAQHIKEIQGKKPETQLEHGEWVLAVGKGFDWLHTPNMALIVGPYDPNIGEPIKTAASIIKSNMEAGRIKKGFVVLSSAIYSDAGEKNRAKERSLYINNLTEEIVKQNFPDMKEFMRKMAVIVDANTMRFEIVSSEAQDD